MSYFNLFVAGYVGYTTFYLSSSLPIFITGWGAFAAVINFVVGFMSREELVDVLDGR